MRKFYIAIACMFILVTPTKIHGEDGIPLMKGALVLAGICFATHAISEKINGYPIEPQVTCAALALAGTTCWAYDYPFTKPLLLVESAAFGAVNSITSFDKNFLIGAGCLTACAVTGVAAYYWGRHNGVKENGSYQKQQKQITELTKTNIQLGTTLATEREAHATTESERIRFSEAREFYLERWNKQKKENDELHKTNTGLGDQIIELRLMREENTKLLHQVSSLTRDLLLVKNELEGFNPGGSIPYPSGN